MESLETKLSQLIHKWAFLFFCLILCLPIFAQNGRSNYDEHLRVRIWANLEQEPGKDFSTEIAQSDNKNSDTDYQKYYVYSAQMLKKLAPTIFEQMIFSTEFEYTPSDKKRNVNEYFSCSYEFDNYRNDYDLKKFITYTDLRVEDTIVYCWAECKLNDALQKRLKKNQSIVVKRIHGKGSGKISDEEKGIQTAFENALKDAVRNYARQITKNKPKEINGKVIIAKEPRFYIVHGQYVADIDFLLEELEIVEYKAF